MTKEEEARKNKQSGMLCSNAIYKVFEKDLSLDGNIPAPRSIEGQCGAVLTTKKILKEIGKEEKAEEYEKEFLENFKSLKCIELMSTEKRCNDYVGFSAAYISKIEKELSHEK